MKIAIINMTKKGMSGGYKKYLINILPRLASDKNIEEILCVSPSSLRVETWFKPIANVKFLGCSFLGFFRLSFDNTLNKELKRFSPDVIFVPVERNFRFKSVPIVNMIQNMEPFVVNSDGNPIGERFRQWIQYVDGRRAIRNSDEVIAISKFVSDFLITHWNVPNEKIGLVYHGIDVKENEDGCKPNIIPEGWQDKFILTAGSIRPARGLEDLLLAMKHIVSHGPNTVRLVIAGEAGPRMIGYQKKLKEWVKSHNLSSNVCWAGYLNEKEMSWCYQNGRIFVMTSRVESFGMIGGESMSHGCICISADNPCLPELFGDVAIFYPPKDEKILAEAIQTVLTWDDNQREIMSEKAKKRAAEFSWDVCAEKTVAVLAKTVGNFNR